MNSLCLAVVALWLGSCQPAPRYQSVITRGSGSAETTNAASFEGEASYYAHKFHGRKTANGEIFDMHAMTAAHKTLPFGTLVRVTNLANQKSVEVRINDRGPFVRNRIIDLSLAAATKLDMLKSGTAHVRVEILRSTESK